MATKPARQPSPFWQRLEDALRDKPLWQPVNANHVAKKLDMSQGSIYRWFTGEGLPELETALHLAKQGGVCVDWLLNNVKPKYPISKDPLLKELFEICEDLNVDARARVLQAAKGERALKEAAEAEEAAKKRA